MLPILEVSVENLGDKLCRAHLSDSCKLLQRCDLWAVADRTFAAANRTTFVLQRLQLGVNKIEPFKLPAQLTLKKPTKLSTIPGADAGNPIPPPASLETRHGPCAVKGQQRPNPIDVASALLRERDEPPTAFGIDGMAIAVSVRTSALPASA
ncbi:hypothetical protein [Sinorhizobium alkalisoli]|uniref:hypothetical protein n=1 Tax=Sinorhizobium alkalisoli TaxID=1752398 RepID=UPI00178C6425|nr:hypothetical protein [Sinorhizobium alkalisoli]